MDTPPAEVEIREGLIEALVAAQHADLLGEVRIVASGWDNVVARLGDDYAVRLPRREVAVPLIRNEARWLPELELPVDVPVPVRVGEPGEGYPWPWLIVPWLPGTRLDTVAVAERRSAASDLGAAHRVLHRPAPPDAPRNPVRGVPLAERSTVVWVRIESLPSRLTELWHAALAVPEYTGPPVWLHGDSHPANLLVDAASRLSAILDFGDITAGDPASDLAVAWLAFDADGRSDYRAARDPDDALWARGRGWAVALTSAFLERSDDNPAMRAIGDHALAELLAEP